MDMILVFNQNISYLDSIYFEKLNTQYSEQPIGIYSLYNLKSKLSQKRIILGNLLNPSISINNPIFYNSVNGTKILSYQITNYFFKKFNLIFINPSFFYKNKNVFGFEFNIKTGSNDIVQGIPKIQQLISIMLKEKKNNNFLKSNIFFEKNFIFNDINLPIQNLKIFGHIQNLFTKNIIIFYNKKLYNIIALPKNLFFFNIKKNNYKIEDINNIFYNYKKKNSILEKNIFIFKDIVNNLLNYNYLNNYNNYIFFSIYQFEKLKFFLLQKYWPILKKNDNWIFLIFNSKVIKWIKKYPINWISNIFNIKKLYFLTLKNLNIILFNSFNGNFFILEPIDYSGNLTNYISKNQNSIFFFNKNMNQIKYNSFILNFIYLGENFEKKNLLITNLINQVFNYNILINGIWIGLIITIYKLQCLFSKSILINYKSQNIKLAKNYTDIITKKIILYITIENPRNTSLFHFETLKLHNIYIYYKTIEKRNKLNLKKKNLSKAFYQLPNVNPILYSLNENIFFNNSFLYKIAYQNIYQSLIKASILNNIDWFFGFIQQISTGYLTLIGSNFLHSKFNLDYIYLNK